MNHILTSNHYEFKLAWLSPGGLAGPQLRPPHPPA